MRSSKIAVGFILIMVLMLASACGGGSPLVGRWEAVSVEWANYSESHIEHIEEGEFIFDFFSDGNGAITDREWTDDFTWSAEGGRIMITLYDEIMVGDYDISRSVLTMTFQTAYEDDLLTEILIFQKVN
ncbi:MAG: hypothetical protein FWD01_04510 [Defluviitaleaceae bacterium]|nr:hypothetical protein [Defluviitaleaceae bacterium]